MKRPIVFLGLSLDADSAGNILMADYRPPIRLGDLDGISPPQMVVIIDGILNKDERIQVDEVRKSIHRGNSLFGVSSTGALLAVDLRSDGMVGYGRVFSFLRQYEGDREDLIAMIYYPGMNGANSVPLINVVLEYQDAGFPNQEISALIRSLTQIPLFDRNWITIEQKILNIGLPLLPTIRAANIKQADARGLLGLLRSQPASLELQ